MYITHQISPGIRPLNSQPLPYINPTLTFPFLTRETPNENGFPRLAGRSFIAYCV